MSDARGGPPGTRVEDVSRPGSLFEPRPGSLFEPRPGSLFEPSSDLTTAELQLPAAPPRRRRPLRVLGVVALVVMLVASLGGAAAFLALQQLSSNIPRVPNVFNGLDESQRPAPVFDRVSFLLMATDSRQASVRRGDEVQMLARVDVNLDPASVNASVVSIPTNSWVEVPDRGPGKISAAYGIGGPALLVRTVEQLTRVRVDHFATIDFAGFQQLVDAVGGIDVPVTGQGPEHLDGRAALAYVSNGTSNPADYANRAARPQAALRALLDKATADGTLNDPIKLFGLLDLLGRSVTLDDTLSNGRLQGLALQMRGLHTSDMQFLVLPVRKVGWERGQPVVYPDDSRSVELWTAVQGDSTVAYLKKYPQDSATVPR